MQKNKMNLICNKITFLELFIKQMITREDEMDKEQYKSYLKTSFDLIIKPELQRIREAGERMEKGLFKRKGFMEAYELESQYQGFKNNKK